ncbi:MAG TPA: sodium:solute symporter, partial [Pedobacter sp.]
LGSYIYGTILGVFLVAFYLKHVNGKAVFYAALLTEVIVCVCGWQKVVAYLWLNLIGCVLVVLIALLFQELLKKKTAAVSGNG